ncbi:MAG: hydantoinase/oxoprolinase family protein [Acetobacteraceae bacterium]
MTQSDPAGQVAVGVDIGGTFTDIVCERPGAPPFILKLPTTRDDPAEAVLAAIAHLERSAGVAAHTIAHFRHGTTIATNAILERKGARIGLIMSEGFRDVLEIGAQLRPDLYRAILAPATPGFLVPGHLRKEVPEQRDARGRIVVPLDEDALARAADELAAAGARAIAVCFLFSFLDPTHERRAREIITARHPTVMVSLSSEVDPAFREYERTVVTAFDATIKPVVDRYLADLERGLAGAGVTAPLAVMQSRGGLAGTAVARRRPVRLFLSGPAAGVIGGTEVGRAAGEPDLITIDVGGTSSDIALVEGGEPVIRAEGTIAGFPVRVPMVDVNTLGAGGGSIAWIDAAGGLRVGPHSAGAEPGPAAYARGGTEATVTDASIVLGYLDPMTFAGGTLPLDPALAIAAVENRIARPLGLSVEDAALGIHRVVNAAMVEGIRLVSIRRGFDPRRFTLVALGGAGPIHAAALAAELEIQKILVPRHPGVLSAAGLLAASIEHEVSMAFPRPLAGLALPEVRAALARLDEECARLMALDRADPAATSIRYFADMLYIGQSYHLAVAIAPADADSLARLYDDFLALHDRVYGHRTGQPAAIVNLRTVHRWGHAPMAGHDAADRPAPAEASHRPVHFESGRAMAAIHARSSLLAGRRLAGPAIVQQPDTTTLVPPGWQATVRADGSLLLQRASAAPTEEG